MAKQQIGRQLAVSLEGDVVKIEVICNDLYEANVLYEDLVDRLGKGERITRSCKQDKAAEQERR